MVKYENAYLVGVHKYCFKAGEKCRVIGVSYVQPNDDDDYRLAYKVVYDNGAVDYVAVSDVEAGNWQWVSELEVGFGMLPGVSR